MGAVEILEIFQVEEPSRDTNGTLEKRRVRRVIRLVA